jgi:hypothetical protein
VSLSQTQADTLGTQLDASDQDQDGLKDTWGIMAGRFCSSKPTVSLEKPCGTAGGKRGCFALGAVSTFKSHGFSRKTT